MGGDETSIPVDVEPSLRYHPWEARSLREARHSGSLTLPGGQFHWGGGLLKCNGGVQRFPHTGQKSVREYKGKGSLTARPTSQAGTKVGLIDPTVPRGRAVA